MKKWILRIALSLVILGGASLMIAIYKYDLLPLQEATCSANAGLSLPIDNYIQDYKGKSILEFPASLYLDSIFKEFPEIEKASVKIHPKGTVNFGYALKQPFVLVNLDKIYGLTMRGELVPAVAADLPIITGIAPGHYRLYDRLPTSRIGYAMKLIRIINTLSPEFRQNISEINLAHSSGLSIHLRDTRPELILGQGEELRKLLLVERIAGFLNALGEEVNSIDFRFDNQLVLKKTS